MFQSDFFMKHLIYILIGFFVLCSTASSSYGQSSRRKRTTTIYKGDSFSGKSKKGPNIHSSKGPRTKSRSKLYSHSISKKKLKNKNRSVFSSKKRRYKSLNAKPKGKGDKGAKSATGGRKSGKGRKKK